MGSPMDGGVVVRAKGSNSDSATNLNGYSIVRAANISAVKKLVKDHPFLSLGAGEYSVEIFELAR